MRAEAALAGRARALPRPARRCPPSEPVEPEAVALPEDAAPTPLEPLEVLVRARARAAALDLTRRATRWTTRGAARRSPRQNLLPQLDLNLGRDPARPGHHASGRPGAPATAQLNVFLTSVATRWSARAARPTSAVAELEVDARAARPAPARAARSRPRCARRVRELEQIRKSVELQQKAVEVAEQQRRLATLRYQRGLATNFDVVDAEGSLVAGAQRARRPAHQLPGRALRPAARHRHPRRRARSSRREHAGRAARRAVARALGAAGARSCALGGGRGAWLRREAWTRRAGSALATAARAHPRRAVAGAGAACSSSLGGPGVVARRRAADGVAAAVARGARSTLDHRGGGHAAGAALGDLRLRASRATRPRSWPSCPRARWCRRATC